VKSSGRRASRYRRCEKARSMRSCTAREGRGTVLATRFSGVALGSALATRFSGVALGGRFLDFEETEEEEEALSI